LSGRVARRHAWRGLDNDDRALGSEGRGTRSRWSDRGGRARGPRSVRPLRARWRAEGGLLGNVAGGSGPSLRVAPPLWPPTHSRACPPPVTVGGVGGGVWGLSATSSQPEQALGAAPHKPPTTTPHPSTPTKARAPPTDGLSTARAFLSCYLVLHGGEKRYVRS